MKKVFYFLQAVCLLVAEKIILLMGLRFSSFVFGNLFVLFGWMTKPSFLALKNLKLALPNLTKKERIKIMFKMWNHLGRDVAEFVFFTNKPMKNIEKYFYMDETIKQKFLDIKNYKEGQMILMAHFGNWEIFSQIANLYKMPFTIFYRNLNNPFASKFILKHRKATGFEFIEKKEPGAIVKLLKSIKMGKKVMIFLDQRDDNGIVVPFFNILSKTSSSLGVFTLKYNVKSYSVAAFRRGNSCFFDIKIDEFKPIKTGNIEEDIIATTIKMNEKIEEWIKEAPEQWFCWIHNRWKGNR
ncbi:MAG: lysophospholipid acyltransferase family protein [Rickettsiales bacterium]|jgi:KDO2-lipid IV(A) lauroyltransferase|nr:lysophospholipid acyltransferase family protein [Rickettsiales bacterium]